MNGAPTTVVIAGAGVVGLAVAALLVKGRCADGLRVHVLDARPVPRWRAESMDPRVYALSRASQQLFEHLGAWERVTATRAAAYRRMRVFQGADPDAPGALDFDSAEIGEPDLGHIVEDSLLRTVLADTIAAAPNATLAVGAEIAAVAVEPRSVVADLVNGGSVRGSVLLAADGSDSTVRRLLDLPVVEHRYEQTAVVTHVTGSVAHRDTAWQRFMQGGPLAFLPLTDGRSSVVWSLPTADAERLLAADEAEFLAALDDASAGVLGKLVACSARVGFPLKALHAPHYTVPRIALLGDAAHTVHPLAGQGMNLGLLDAACVAAVIEAALLAGEDAGDRKVLRRYERERKGDNLKSLAAFDGLNRLFRLSPWTAPVRALGLAAVDASGPVKRALMREALGLRAGRRHRLRWS
ncbi:MAG TPA: UbiH/UbiF/VisC/COQ6 family ubiquinone biosynthesis hydroxylase [Gammaproteobacteria bacterium]|nr:UbiH/UbiF/VisC/COQ6 family ubiquinone biosynthesis hydroxylase [Gammaproteobacteria bacterium]